MSPWIKVCVDNNGDSLRKRLARVETLTCIGVQRRMYSRRKCWDAGGRQSRRPHDITTCCKSIQVGAGQESCINSFHQSDGVYTSRASLCKYLIAVTWWTRHDCEHVRALTG